MTSTWLILPCEWFKDRLDGAVKVEGCCLEDEVVSASFRGGELSLLLSGAQPKKVSRAMVINILSWVIYKYFEQIYEFGGTASAPWTKLELLVNRTL